MHVSEYRAAWDPETRASRPPTGPHSDATRHPRTRRPPTETKPTQRHTAPRDEWAEAYASPIRTPEWASPAACQHQAIREWSIGGTLRDRSCIDCGQPLPDRAWDD